MAPPVAAIRTIVGRVTPAPEPTDSTTISWVDPSVALPRLAELSGLDYLTAILDGELPPPPISQLMGFTAVSFSRGEAVFECSPTTAHFNPLGVVHGGLACTLLDTVLGCAGHTTLPAGVGYTSVDLSVVYLRPILPGNAPLRATGRVRKGGRRVIFSEGEVVGADGAVLATGTSSLLVIDRRDGSGD